MGQFLACGVAVQFIVFRNSKTEGKDINDLINIKNRLKKYFSIDNYEVDDKSYNNLFLFSIKKDYLERNIHGVIRELSNLYELSIEDVFGKEYGKLDFSSKDFCQEKYPLKLKNMNNYGKKRLQVVGTGNCLNDMEQFSEPAWLYERNSIFGWGEKYRLRIIPAAIWIDCDKWCGEDETNMLLTLNTMKISYFKNPLSKNLFYYIFG